MPFERGVKGTCSAAAWRREQHCEVWVTQKEEVPSEHLHFDKVIFELLVWKYIKKRIVLRVLL